MKKYLIITIAFFISTCLSSQDLQLITPNGGEVLNAGSETEITWEGVSEDEIVKLEFSSDNGETWEEITRNTTGNKYNWDVPFVSSDSCLIRVKQYSGESLNDEGEIEWERSFGGSGNDSPISIIQTTDNGYVTGGRSDSKDGDISNFKGNVDYWIVKLDEYGDIQWEKSYGGSGYDYLYSIQQTNDGGYIAAGMSDSEDGDITSSKGAGDYWIIKIGDNGELEWEKSYGGNKLDQSKSIQQTNDGGYIAAGISDSEDGDITNPNGGPDYWILKLKDDGSKEWEKSYGGLGMEILYSIQNTFDDGFIISGSSNSEDGDITNPKGRLDYWIVKLDEHGVIQWEKSYGGSKDDYPYSIRQTIDSGYIVAGMSDSEDGDITSSKGAGDYWILKVDKNGVLEWEISFGGSKQDYALSVQQTIDSGYIVAGMSDSEDGDITSSKGAGDYWIIKVDKNGVLEWEKSYGGNKRDQANSIQQTQDGGYIVAGNSGSSDGDVSENKGKSDYWIVKLSGDNLIQSDKSDAVFKIKSPELRIQNNDIDLGQMIIGKSKDTVVTAIICNDGDVPLDIQRVEITSGDENDFNIKNGAKGFTLDEGYCRDILIEYTPTEVGKRIALATVRTAMGDFQDTIRIRGDGIKATSINSEEEQTINNVKLKIKPNFTVNKSLIEFETSKAGNVKLEIYNSTGTKVKTILNEFLEPGRREMTLDLSDFATGRYYIQLSTPTVTKTEILEVVK